MIWSDRGSGGKHDFSIWKPKIEGAFVTSHIGVRGYGKPNLAYAIRPFNVNDVKYPIRYDRIWNDRGSGAHSDVQIFLPIPPPGYTCIGNVAVNNYHDLPRYDSVVCIINHFTYLAPAFWMWNDAGSGSNSDGSCFGVHLPPPPVYNFHGTYCADGYPTVHHLPTLKQEFLVELDPSQIQSAHIHYDLNSQDSTISPSILHT